jgi:hypothetical protein
MDREAATLAAGFLSAKKNRHDARVRRWLCFFGVQGHHARRMMSK